MSMQGNRSMVETGETAESLNQRCLAGAVSTEKAHYLTIVYMQREICEGLKCAVPFCQMLDLDTQ